MCRIRISFPVGGALEWVMQQAFLAPMVSSASADHALRRDFLKDHASLRYRLLVLAVVSVFALPVVLLGLLLYSMLHHIGEARASGDYFGPRKWSPWSLWRMREVNEMPHTLQQRSGAAAVHADRYLQQFQSPCMAAVARTVAFIASALLACAVLPSVLSNRLAVSLFIPAGGFSLVWYAAILAAIVAAARGMVPGHESAWLDPVGAMRNMAAYFHRVPEHWLSKSSHASVRDEVSSEYLKHRLWLLLSEIGGVLFLPVLLAVVLPRQAPRIARVLEERTVVLPGIGAVCDNSLMDLELDPDPDVHAQLVSCKT